jgi:uncharacterized repeat protein (TIGR03803 family)
MGRRRFVHFLFGGVAVFSLLASMVGVAWAGTTRVAYSFMGGADGEYPSTDLVRDGAGDLYGTTVQGGDFGGGSVFELKPSNTGWTHSVLYSFRGEADGGQPYGGVTLDPQGNLYGTTVIGGTRTGSACVEDGCGVAYELVRSAGGWTEKVIHTFTGGDDGYGPGAGLTIDQHHNLYGMTPVGGTAGLGVIFEVRPLSTGTWKLNVIHPFTGGADGGSASAGRLLLGGGGDLYGVATTGGANGSGTAFRLHLRGDGNWRFRTLYAFGGQPDAGFPYGALSFDGSGNLFGTTYYDGANDLGAVYELSPTATGLWHESVLYSFTGGRDGNGPISNVVFDTAGDLFGTTSEGGSGCGCGTIFKLARTGAGSWVETVPYRFRGSPGAAFPYNGMVADGSGNLFGATVHGGTDNEGAVYEFTP